MINQVKKDSVEQKREDRSPSQIISSPNKFQRTNRRGIRSPGQTNVNSQKPEYKAQKITQQYNQRHKLISRTSKAAIEIVKSPDVEKFQPINIEKNINSTSTYPSTIEASLRSRVSDIKMQSRVSPEVDTVQVSKVQMNSSRQRIKTDVIKMNSNNVGIKKAGIIGYIILRLLKNRVITGFLRLKENNFLFRRKMNYEAKCLLLATCALSYRYQLNNYRISFQKFKIRSNSSEKAQFNKFSQIKNINSCKERQIISVILNIMQRQKMRQYFNKLKQYIFHMNNLKCSLILLNGYQKKKIKHYFFILKRWTKHINEKKKKFIQIIINYHNLFRKQSLIICYSKIKQYYRPQMLQNQKKYQYNYINNRIMAPQQKNKTEASRIPLNYSSFPQLKQKIMVLNHENLNISEDLKISEKEIEQKKNYQGKEIETNKNKIEQLKTIIIKMQKSVHIKKNANQSIKNKISVKVNSSSSDDFHGVQETIKGQQTLRFLQQIYSQLYKTNENELNTKLSQILRANQIDLNDSPEIIKESALILQKIRLQKEIDLYETSILDHKSLAYDNNTLLKTVKQQNEIVTSMIRNFVRQRYLWKEVQKFVSAVL